MLHRLWNWLRAKYKIVLIVASVIYVSLLALAASPIVTSDGFYYYTVARSIVDKGTFVYDTRPEYYDNKGHAIFFDGKVYKDVGSPGAAFAMAPGLAISKLFRDPAVNTYNDYFMAYSGHTLLDGIAMLLTAIVFGTVSLIYLYKLARIYIPSTRTAVLLTTAIFTSCYILNYIFLKSFYTHTFEFFGSVIFLYNIVMYNKNGKARHLIAAGLAGSFGFTARPLFFVPPLIFGIYLLIKRRFKDAIIFALSNLPFILLWFAYNYVSYGKIIASGYSEIRNENYTFDSFYLIPLLISPWKGWFLWSPFLVSGFIGFFLKIKNKLFTHIDFICLASVIFVLLTYSFWWAWWGGGSYGTRFMIVNAPLLLPGAAYLFQILKGKKRLLFNIFTILCICFSSFFSLLYLVSPDHSPKNMLMFHINSTKELLANPIKHFADSRYAVDMEIGAIDVLIHRARTVVKLDDRTPGSLTFLLFDIGQEEKPESLQGFIKNTQTGEVRSLELNLDLLNGSDNASATLSFTEQGIISNNSNLIIGQNPETTDKFLPSEYNMFILENSPYKIFLPNTNKIREVGPNRATFTGTGYYH